MGDSVASDGLFSIRGRRPREFPGEEDECKWGPCCRSTMLVAVLIAGCQAPGPRSSSSIAPTRRRPTTCGCWIQRFAGAQRLPAGDPSAGRPLDRLCRPSRRQAEAESADRAVGEQRHFDRRRHRSRASRRYLAHIPGEEGGTESGGAQMVRLCDGTSCPRAIAASFTCCARSAPRRTKCGMSPTREAGADYRPRARSEGHAQELVGVRYRHRVPGLRRAAGGRAG